MAAEIERKFLVGEPPDFALAAPQEDIDQVYLLQANCYPVKPPGVEEFFTMVRKIVEFWWQTARLPNGPLPRPPKDRQQ